MGKFIIFFGIYIDPPLLNLLMPFKKPVKSSELLASNHLPEQPQKHLSALPTYTCFTVFIFSLLKVNYYNTYINDLKYIVKHFLYKK
jgi:hypothetical protein